MDAPSSLAFPARVSLREVGLRDGLQSRSQAMDTETKAEIFRHLIAAGFEKINAVALVHPNVMPHMADAEKLLHAVGPVPECTVSALVPPSPRGLARARELHKEGLLDEVHFINAATKAVLAANGVDWDVEENHKRIVELASEAREAGLRTLVFIAASFGCSVEGYVPPSTPLEAARALEESGVVDEVTFSDSTGQATPRQVWEFFRDVRTYVGLPVTAHFHDSRGSGLANVLALLQVGLDKLTIDAAFAGLGGDVPFLVEAAGNICTEDLLSMLEGSGVETGIALDEVLAAARIAGEFYADPVPSHTLQVGPRSWTPPTVPSP